MGQRQIADDLREKIRDGRYPVDTRLPTQRDLAVEYKVTVQTISNAIGLLRREGIVRSESTTATIVNAMPGEAVTLEAVDQRTAALVDELETLKERVGALEAKLADLFSRTAHTYKPGGGNIADRPDRQRKSS